jgi:hypothetical protein
MSGSGKLGNDDGIAHPLPQPLPQAGGEEVRARKTALVPVSWTLMPEGAQRLRPRTGGFTPRRQKKFIKWLGKTGCVRDACRKARVTSQTAYRTRERLPEFRRHWQIALEMAASDLEILAWDRAMRGVEEVITRDGETVYVRRKPSDGVFRLLMRGANPRKYGRMGALRRKQIVKEVRAQAEAERLAELGSSYPITADELRASINARLDAAEAALRAPDPGLDGEGI